MSKTESPPTDDDLSDEEDDEHWIDEHRDQIEREANSDAPDAWVFQRLLDNRYEDGGSS